MFVKLLDPAVSETLLFLLKQESLFSCLISFSESLRFNKGTEKRLKDITFKSHFGYFLVTMFLIGCPFINSWKFDLGFPIVKVFSAHLKIPVAAVE